MKKPFLLLLALIVFNICNPVKAQSKVYATQNGFYEYYDISNWEEYPNSGNINTSGAPLSIEFESGDSGHQDSTYIQIEIPADGIVQFNWSYTTSDTDGSDYDFPFYMINGESSEFSSFNRGGADTQSGIETINVSKGQTFALGVYTIDGQFGSATIEAFSFSAPVVPVSFIAVLSSLGLIGMGTFFRFRKKKRA